MTYWEYTTRTITCSSGMGAGSRAQDITEQLNAAGREGWELVHLSIDSINEYNGGTATFKRPRPA